MQLLKNKNFSNLFLGRLLSNCGDTIYAIVLSWYILEYSNNAYWVGILNFLIFLPNVFSFISGKVIDRFSKKKILILLEVTQCIAVTMITLSMFFMMKTSNKVALYSILFFAFIASIAGINTYTVQDAFVPSIVKKEDLAQSEIYMSIAYNGSEYLFSTITGFLMSIFSYINLLIVDIFSFILSVHLFKKIDNIEVINEKNNEEGVNSLFSGISYIIKNKLLLLITLGSGLLNFLFAGLNIYQLLLSQQMGGAKYYGIIIATASIGTLLGSSIVANFFIKILTVGRVLCLFSLLFGISFSLISFVTNPYVFILIWFIAFIFLGITQVVQKPILQSEIAKYRLGEVLGAFYTLTVSTLAVGSLFWGTITEILSSRFFFLTFGLSYTIIAIIYFLNKKLNNYMPSSELEESV
ncbi:MFS-type transporter involved in bile tolerance, Atg22 family [Streptococcus henryi]|uniref:MFS-type transporter involved in bile tolerance, Atg22 family n=1 Tax=Streptococcus henryi TaxID=439219 RepID=A0A1G6AMS5_9STRE|nr:MFS transporter [Streptococcus henryi]SDB09698.1 MFS-type transporter involved in bile tolerance, Atg22 family [Streptococcus henryi]